MSKSKEIRLTTGGMNVVRQIASLPFCPEVSSSSERLQFVLEESMLRDQLVTYGYEFDSKDLDAVMNYFSEDCVIVNPRGRYVGRDTIRKNYEFLFNYWPLMRQILGNVSIRFLSTEQAYRAYYFFGILSSDEQSLATVGTDIHHLSKINGEWKIVERCIEDDFASALTLHEGAVERVTDR
jgi:hypothetical protein